MRLIDAEKFKKQMSAMALTSPSFFTSKVVKLLKIIDKQPTAFDVEAVVKELEDTKLIRVEQCHEDYELEVMTASNFDDAIEIVRKGGVK